MAEPAGKILERLLGRGDVVAVASGRLAVSPASGAPVPADWLQQHERPLIAEAARAAGVEALEYLGHTAGNYGSHLAGGVTLQFRSLLDGGGRHAIFNAETRRARTTKGGKAGDPLPAGQFRVGERSAFYKFWLCTGLPFQSRSNLYQRVGNLRSLVYSGSISDGERIEAGTLRPLEITAEQLRGLTTKTINSQLSRNQVTTNSQSTLATKEIPQPQQPRDLEPNQTAGADKRGNTVIREHGYTGNPSSPQETGGVSPQEAAKLSPEGYGSRPPQEQTNEEWLADYERRDRELTAMGRR